jgi:hypothetical protein
MRAHTALSIGLSAWFLAFIGCSSPLSDVDITDFGVINGSFAITESFNSAGGTSQTVRASLTDKNFANVEIKDGGVTVNGTAMTYDDNTFVQCYTKDNLVLAKNTLYRFVITLSNAATCTSSVTTPPAAFGTVMVPSTISLSQGATVTWTDTARSSSVNVTLSLDSLSRIVFQQAALVDDGKVVIPAESDSTLTGRATLTLARKNTGTVAAPLRGGDISASVTFTASVTIIR